MPRKREFLGFLVMLALAAVVYPVPAAAQKAGPKTWQNDLTAIGPGDWNYDFAAHLLEPAQPVSA